MIKGKQKTSVSAQPGERVERPLPGWPVPEGATLMRGGVNFAVASRYATAVDILLFQRPEDAVAKRVIRLGERTGLVWHGFVPGLGAGQLYGLRCHGPFTPDEGHRFNSSKLLLDPYAHVLAGDFAPSHLLLGYCPSVRPNPDKVQDRRPSAGAMPKCVVVDQSFDWEDDRPPNIPLHELILYEVHVKGFTADPSSHVAHPGSFLGLIEKIDHLRDLGINAVELLPVQQAYTDLTISRRGLRNYWGYSTVAFFAPDLSLASSQRPGDVVREFKTMVKALHRAGIEVILDVVYNHTGEGNHLGPTLCFKGVDNRSYYLLFADRSYYADFTGCGNTVDFSSPLALKMVMDSLRYWVEVMHVDGFRFDLATVMGRERGFFHPEARYFHMMFQDPVLRKVKLIAEPWDIGTYEVGRFPVGWAEWNGKYRDSVRRFVRGDHGMVSDLGYRLTGSSDLYSVRGPLANINFITCHDGFTLNDMVSYTYKRNIENGENNRDGTDNNMSHNWGFEGPTDNPEVEALRSRALRNFMAILFLSQGMPMMLGGDEFRRTQRGNNNAYCQDNPISWFDWSLVDTHADLLRFVKEIIAFRKAHPSLRRRRFFSGADTNGDGVVDIVWLDRDLRPLRWHDPSVQWLAYLIDGSEATDGRDDDLYIAMNMSSHALEFALPPARQNHTWKRAIDTSYPPGQEVLRPGTEQALATADRYLLQPRSVVVLASRPLPTKGLLKVRGRYLMAGIRRLRRSLRKRLAPKSRKRITSRRTAGQGPKAQPKRRRVLRLHGRPKRR